MGRFEPGLQENEPGLHGPVGRVRAPRERTKNQKKLEPVKTNKKRKNRQKAQTNAQVRRGSKMEKTKSKIQINAQVKVR